MSKKTVWYISQYASPEKYGFGTRHFYIADELSQQGYNMVIISSTCNHLIHSNPPDDEIYNFEEINKTKVCWIKGISYNNPAGFLRVLSWFQFTFRLMSIPKGSLPKPDYIIVSSLSLPPIIAGIHLKRSFTGSKLIFEIRDIWPKTLIEIGGKSKFHPLVILLGIIEKYGYKKSDMITSTLPRANDHIDTRIKKQYKFRCIPQGLPKSIIESEDKKQLVPFTLPDNKFIIGFAGSITRSNAPESLIRVSKEIYGSHPEILIAILGEGNYRKRLQDIAKGSENVIFLDKVNRSQVIHFLNKCDLLYDSVKNVPIYQYGLSKNKWMDYMFSGKPIIVSYSGYVTLINEAECGLVIPSEDLNSLKEGILKFYNMSYSKRLEIGERGRNYVINHRDYSTIASMYDKCFKEII